MEGIVLGDGTIVNADVWRDQGLQLPQQRRREPIQHTGSEEDLLGLDPFATEWSLAQNTPNPERTHRVLGSLATPELNQEPRPNGFTKR